MPIISSKMWPSKWCCTMLMTVLYIPQKNGFLENTHSEKYSFMFLGVDDSLQTNMVEGDEFLENTKQEHVLG